MANVAPRINPLKGDNVVIICIDRQVCTCLSIQDPLFRCSVATCAEQLPQARADRTVASHGAPPNTTLLHPKSATTSQAGVYAPQTCNRREEQKQPRLKTGHAHSRLLEPNYWEGGEEER